MTEPEREATDEKIPFQLNTETQAALARKFDAQAEHERQMARKAEAEADAAVVATREQKAASLKMALIAERQVETIMGEDEYRRIYQFRGEVTKGSVEKALIYLNAWHASDPTGDWEIHLFTPGGEMYAGLRLLDYLSIFKAQGHKITTVSMGASMSMGSILLQAGTVRRMGRESTVLIHKGSLSGWVEEDFDDLEDQMRFIKRRQERIARLFAARAAQADPAVATEPITVAYLKRRWNHKNWYLDSDECLRRGIVDEVI